MNRLPYLIDTTLRDGEQAPDVVFSQKEKMRLAEMLDETGIDEIEVGTPAMGKDECNVIRNIAHLNLKATLSVWSRAVKKDIAQAGTLGVKGIHVAFPLSDIQLRAMHKTYDWVEDLMGEIIQYARRFFTQISVGAQDASRCPSERLFRLIDMAEGYGAWRVRLADTVGILTPVQTVEMIRSIKDNRSNVNIDFHAHDDFGMATANAFTAYQTGADALSVTVNGLGERAGNAALEEIVMALQQQTPEDVKYNLSGLFDLCRYVATISKRPLPEGKAVCGRFALSHESGIHAQATLSDTLAFQPFDGNIIGRERLSILFGKHSGKRAVIALLKRHSIDIKEDEIPLLMEKIRSTASTLRRSLLLEEVVDLYLNEITK